MSRVNEAGIPCFTGSCSEVYLEPAFENTDLRPTVRLPNARLLGETSLMFLCDQTISKEKMSWIAEKVDEIVNEYFSNMDTKF